MPTTWVRLGAGREYPIHVKPGVLKETGSLVKARVKGRVAGVLSHPRIFKQYGKLVVQSLKAAGFTVECFMVPEGETSKSLDQVERVIGKLLTQRLDRSSFLVALGGGVIGDLTGFLAAVYMRGIDFVQIPTSLLAQVDSSVGGKVAVNHAKGKNIIGAFLQPRVVITDPSVLKTLPARQFRSGLAEMIKAAIIADQNFFGFLEAKLPQLLKLDMTQLSQAIAASCGIKARVVEQDEKERGLRAILNYGHTFGHALETYHHYRGYLHGEAVALGMVMASHLAHQWGICSELTWQRQVKLIKAAGLPIQGKRERVSTIIALMKNDKKASKGENKFVLTPHIGHASIVQKIPPFSVSKVLHTVLGHA